MRRINVALVLLSGFLGAAVAAQTKPAPLFHGESFAGRRRFLGDDHPDTILSISNLGGLLQEMGKLDGAELLLLEAYWKFSQRAAMYPSGDKRGLNQTLERLVDLCQAQNESRSGRSLALETGNGRGDGRRSRGTRRISRWSERCRQNVIDDDPFSHPRRS